jgi:hypothetical protein
MKHECSVCSQLFDRDDLLLFIGDETGLEPKKVYTISDLKTICKSCNRDRVLNIVLNKNKVK